MRPRFDNKLTIAKWLQRCLKRHKVSDQSVARAVFWACTKDWPRLIWSFSWSYVHRRFVSKMCGDRFRLEKGGDVLQPSGDLSATDWSIGASSVTGGRSVAKSLIMQTSPTCVRITAFITCIHRVRIEDLLLAHLSRRLILWAYRIGRPPSSVVRRRPHSLNSFLKNQ